MENTVTPYQFAGTNRFVPNWNRATALATLFDIQIIKLDTAARFYTDSPDKLEMFLESEIDCETQTLLRRAGYTPSDDTNDGLVFLSFQEAMHLALHDSVAEIERIQLRKCEVSDTGFVSAFICSADKYGNYTSFERLREFSLEV